MITLINMSLEEKISNHIKEAMLNKNSIRLNVLRAIKSAILLTTGAIAPTGTHRIIKSAPRTVSSIFSNTSHKFNLLATERVCKDLDVPVTLIFELFLFKAKDIDDAIKPKPIRATCLYDIHFS